jgi:hypothetical protein
MPIQIRILPRVLHLLKIQNFFSTFIHSSYSLLYIVLSFLVASKVSYCLVFFRQFWQCELEPIKEENRQQTKQPTKKNGGGGGMKKSRTGTG